MKKNILRALLFVLSGVAVASVYGASIMSVRAAGAADVNVWWPASDAHVSGVQPFKAMVEGIDVSQYELFWQVDGGQWNWMDNSYTDYPHKEASVDVSSWIWHGAGPYTVNFIARKDGTVIAQRSVTIYTGAAVPATVASAAPPQPSSAPAQPSVSVQAQTQQVVPASTPGADPFAGAKLYKSAQNPAKAQAQAWRSSRPADAAAMDTLAATPVASWFGSWNADVYHDVQQTVSAAAAQGAVPVLVAYNIPGRDCGGYSQGGANSADAYRSWVGSFAAALGNAKAAVILEPDALAGMDCLSTPDQQARLSLIAGAVATLKKDANAAVYVDAGHVGWADTGVMADRLRSAGVAQADGFALNVSNFTPTADNVTYGSAISQALGQKHFVIDTSRNGQGSDGQWCNPPGRGLGASPTAATGNPLVDAFLWIKTPGESDGPCQGGPSAGQWWADYALQLVHNAAH